MREGWSYKKLGEVCKTTSGGTPSKAHSEYYEGGTIPWLRSGEVKQGAIFETEMFITEEGLNNSSAKIVPEDSVAVAMYGATVGQVGIIKAPMCTNQAICCILPSKELLPDYLYRFLSSKKEEYLKNAIGGAQPNISQAEIKKTLVSIPPLTTQQQIVSELDLLSHILDQKRQQLKEYDALAESIFYDMFGDPVENPKGWEKKRLSEVCEYIVDGDHMPPPKSDTGIPFITISNVDKENKTIDFTSTYFVPNDYYNNLKEDHKPKVGDVLYTVTGSYGIPVLVKEERPFCFQRHIGLLHPNKDLNSCFLFGWAGSHDAKRQADEVATGIAQKTVSLKNLRQFEIPLPPLDLQRSFAAKIESIEHQKQLLRASIKETEMLFQSRMDYWFNG